LFVQGFWKKVSLLIQYSKSIKNDTFFQKPCIRVVIHQKSNFEAHIAFKTINSTFNLKMLLMKKNIFLCKKINEAMTVQF